MRSSSSKGKANGDESIPVENGLSQTEDGEEAHKLAAKVVDTVVKLASQTAEQRSRGSSPARAELEKLPTIQIDTVPSPPWSPSESTDSEPPLDEAHIDINIDEQQQNTVTLTEEEKESVRSFVEEILAEAMVVAEKKLKFADLDDDDETAAKDTKNDDKSVSNPDPPDPEPRLSQKDEAEVREAAEKVVEEVLTKAQETAADRLTTVKDREFPDMPTFQIDTVKSPPPSPEDEIEQEQRDLEMTKDSKVAVVDESVAKKESTALITFDEAPDDVKDVASNFVKEIVGKAISQAEEKAVPSLPFTFDVDLIKSSGPWYVRVREGFMRVLRSACFCTPRRNDS